MWAAATSSRDNWERLVAAVIKRDQIRQLFHQDSITTVDSDFSDRDLSLRYVSSPPSPQRPFARNSAVQVRRGGSGTITQKLFSALLWRRKPKGFGLVGIPEDHLGFESFSLHELQVATDHFSNRNIVGFGRCGRVYKGRLADGSLVAIKKLTTEVTEVTIREELEMASIVAHRNVLGLLGFCITEKERFYVYPYMANGSVAQCLRERSELQPTVEWEIRPRIALGVARGIAHLHHGCIRGIIHRDVKAANILLDDGFEAVVSDFTLAKFTDCNDVDDWINGTFGHVAPEYLSTGKCSLKNDVYSFGVFLLELISGQPAFDIARFTDDDDVMLLDWAKLWEEREFDALVDQNLRGNFIKKEVNKLLQMAIICTQTDPEGRPTMSEVVRILEDGDGLTEAWEEFSLSYDYHGYYFSKILSDAESLDQDNQTNASIANKSDRIGDKSSQFDIK